jgi:choline dehydrogenase
MVYVRGHARDFDEWGEQGARGWGYADVLPYFKRAERWEGGGDRYRGGDGPLATSNGNGMRNPLYRAFIEAGVQAGYGATDDYNGRRQEGFGPMHMTVRDGLRWSTARAYLRPALGRPNLQLVKHALIDRVLIENGRAGGIAYSTRGVVREARARREVILAAGSIGSPTILQRSGIGPAAHLKALGIPVIADRPGVGGNLRDHLEVYFQFRCLQPLSLNRQLSLWRKGLIGARWVLFRNGLGATNHFEACAFIRSRAGLEWPDVQYHFLPGAMRYDGNAAFDGDGFQVHVGPNKPKSRGRVDIADTDPAAKPKILFNYLQAPEDVEDWRRVIRLTREILRQPAMDPYRGEEIQPGADVTSDAAIDAWVRANVESAYHPSCTCPMGDPEAPETVLRHDLTVIGVEGLRVADSSAFPTIPNGNLNGPTIMLAEKAADLILGRPAPARDNAEVWIAPDWRTAQREGQATSPSS